ncbi:ATP-dependent protease ATPase subunit HslU [Candidatus Dependentiae bacterium]|nr:ATP-dependent protease ATPase subunit HslU [Candidatus Dependentiae bacterium]
MNLENQNLMPKEIVKHLNKYIIGQDEAKKSIAIAIRNRYRRMLLTNELKEEVLPKNILMIGPTGVGKTEIARRMAHILNAPFVKIEATKFTEIGYVGRNVESMIRDLASEAYRLVKQIKEKEVREKAEIIAEERIMELLIKKNNQNEDASVVKSKKTAKKNDDIEIDVLKSEEIVNLNDEIKEKYKLGQYDNDYIEIESAPGMDMVSSMGIISATSDLEEINMNFKEMLDNAFSKKTKKKKIQVSKAKKMFIEEEIEKLLDMEALCEESVKLAENTGIIFIDEIDKIISNGEVSKGPNVSREGVQRDILPIVEGTVVKTRYGNLKTDHVLFIAAGAFHYSKPSDLIPELQGRFPIRVELKSLSKDDFYKILMETKNSLIKQYTSLLKVEKINIDFEDCGVSKIAEYCDNVNKKNDNIGARRLYAIMEKLIEDISFNCDKYANKTVKIDEKFVSEKLKNLVEDVDLSKYIL